MLEGGADAECVEFRADLAQGARLRSGVVVVEAVDAALRVLDEAVGDEDRVGTVVDGGGGDAAVRLPGQDDPVRLGGLDAAQGVVPDLGEGAVVAGEQVAGYLLRAQERVVRQGDAVGLGDAAVRLVGQGAGGDGGEEKAVAFVVPVQKDELGTVGAAACFSGCSARDAATRSKSQTRLASSARSSLASGGRWELVQVSGSSPARTSAYEARRSEVS